MTPKQKDVAFMWAMSMAALSIIIIVLMITKVNSRHITLEVVNVEQANTDIEGFYDMYAKAKTQDDRDYAIERIKIQFKGFDAVQIADLKYRNFLINTRDN